MKHGFALVGSGAKIEIVVDGFERPNAEDESDSEWLVASVFIQLGAVTGLYAMNLTVSDIEILLGELRQVYHELSGEASFNPDEQGLTLAITCGTGGQVSVAGTARVPGAKRILLDFAFETDQSYLGRTLDELQGVAAAYPRKVRSRG